jgi:zinc D-Ala-D-Ala dipeptidase
VSRKLRGLFLACAFGLVWPCRSPAADLPSDFVHLRSVAPEILQDIRYATADNFTGTKVPGYEDGECILRKSVAEALKKANDELSARGLVLKVYDCYRPQRAVDAFMRWGNGGGEQINERYHPRIKRGSLIPLGYIASKSSHSLGIAVDLTIAETSNARRRTVEDDAIPRKCTDSSGTTPKTTALDMGSQFDCFDIKSHTSAHGLTATQKNNRQVLIDAMMRHGFVNYHREWWHFTHRPSAEGARPHDFTVKR